jgi:hypothetical protein
MDVEKFVRHLCRLVLRHQMPVWNYFVNSFYSVQLAASPSLQVQRRQVRGVELLCDVSTAVVLPIVPAACRREVFAAIHYLAHPGLRATRRMVTQRFIWKG